MREELKGTVEVLHELRETNKGSMVGRPHGTPSAPGPRQNIVHDGTCGWPFCSPEGAHGWL